MYCLLNKKSAGKGSFCLVCGGWYLKLTPWLISKQVRFSKYLLSKIHFLEFSLYKVSSYSYLPNTFFLIVPKNVTRRYTVALIPIFQQQSKCPRIISTGSDSLWTGVSRSSLARPCSYHLLRRSYWLCIISTRDAGCVVSCCCFNHFMTANITFALIQQPASRLFVCLTLNSAAISLSFGFESFLWFLACFWSPATLLTTFSRFTAKLKPSFLQP